MGVGQRGGERVGKEEEGSVREEGGEGRGKQDCRGRRRGRRGRERERIVGVRRGRRGRESERGLWG